MSGLEVIGIVTGIITAFSGAVTLVESWRKKKAARLQNASNAVVLSSLGKGETEIKIEYDQDFAKLGKTFAIGDDRGKLELMSHLVTMQQTLITLLQRSTTATTDVVLAKHKDVLSSSETMRLNVISALAQQYQRMSQASRLPRLFLGERDCQGTHRLSPDKPDKWHCSYCRASWDLLGDWYHTIIVEVGDLKITFKDIMRVGHVEDVGKVWCRVCGEVVGHRTGNFWTMNSITWKAHFDTHSSTGMRQAYDAKHIAKSSALQGNALKEKGKECVIM